MGTLTALGAILAAEAVPLGLGLAKGVVFNRCLPMLFRGHRRRVRNRVRNGGRPVDRNSVEWSPPSGDGEK